MFNLEGPPEPNFLNIEVKCCFITLKEPLQIWAVKHFMAEQSFSSVKLAERVLKL